MMTMKGSTISRFRGNKTGKYLGWLDTNARKKLGISERKLDNLTDLSELICEAANISE
jgi:hypothetical protein